MILRGSAHKYGDDVNTDVIIPARYLNVWDAELLAQHCMEDIDLEFRERVKAGDIMVAGTNFGCGSSREHAPIAIKQCGISCVLAESFARIFFRNSINIGLPMLECPAAASECESEDVLEIDLEGGKITNVTKNRTYTAHSYPKFMLDIVEAGGLVAQTKNKLKEVSA